MIFYLRGENSSEYAVTGLDPSLYIPEYISTSTPSIPIMNTDESQIVGFFQTQVEDNLYNFKSNSPVFKIVKTFTKSQAQSIVIEVNSCLGSDSTKLSLEDFFAVPYTTKDSPL